jgi:hypothetical protein
VPDVAVVVAPVLVVPPLPPALALVVPPPAPVVWVPV